MGGEINMDLDLDKTFGGLQENLLEIFFQPLSLNFCGVYSWERADLEDHFVFQMPGNSTSL